MGEKRNNGLSCLTIAEERASLVTQHVSRLEARQELAKLTEDLIGSNSYPGLRLAAARAMFQLFSRLGEISESSLEAEDNLDTFLPSGKAISPKGAALCLLDFARTTKFLQGMEAAIRQAQSRFPGETVEAIYAGCGPFATLALPLCTRFSPGEVKFTLIDVHERSLCAARAIVDRLGLGDFIRSFELCDATLYRVNPQLPAHVMVCETLQRGLAKETQVAITANLAPQMADGGSFVPECVSVDFCLVDLRDEFPVAGGEEPTTVPRERDRIFVSHLLEVTSQAIGTLIQNAVTDMALGCLSLPPVAARVPGNLPDKRLSGIIRTAIQVFDSIALGDYDSGLTIPIVLHDLGPIHPGDRIEFRYLLGNRPGFVYRRL